MRRTEVPKQWEGGGHDSVMEDEISGMVLVPESVKMKTASRHRWAVNYMEVVRGQTK